MRLSLIAYSVGLALAALSGGYATHLHWQAKYTKLELSHSRSETKVVSDSLIRLSKFEQNLNIALATFHNTSYENEKNQKDLTRILLDLRGSVAGLRGDFSVIPGRLEKASRASLAEFATTCSAVFEDVAAAGGRLSERGSEIAQSAERDRAAAQLMIDSWPKD